MFEGMRIKDCIGWLWNVSRGFRLAILRNGVIGVLHVGTSLLFIWICKHLIDIATRLSDSSLPLFTSCLFACIGMQLLLSVIGSRLGSRLEIRLRNRLRYRVFCHVMESRWTGREALHTGDTLNRLIEDVPTITVALCRTVPALLATVLQLAGALFFLSRLDIRLAAVLLCIMPVALLLSKSYVRRMHKLSRDIRDTGSKVQSHLQEHLQHRVLIRTLEYSSQTNLRLDSLQNDLQDKVMRRADFSIFSRLMVQVGFSAGYATAFLWGIFGLQDGTVSFGMMAAFLQLVAQVQRPMVELSRQIPAFVQVLTSAERLSELSSLSSETEGVPVKLDGRPGIRFEHVHFAYPGSKRNVLEDFTHDFAPGSLTAIVGETGAGKSTLVRLMLALLVPDNGKVTVYNEERETAVSPQTRCNLSYVPQGNTLISGTIRDNLLLGNPDATDEELHNALHTASADFVYHLPDGLETLCSEQGAGLSEGQAQRIAIARGLLRPGKILLLDEPTSSLDKETEELFFERLSRQIKDKTLILITHRETIARLCTSVVRIRRNEDARNI